MSEIIKYRFQRRFMINRERFLRMGVVAGITFLLLYWLPVVFAKTPQNQTEQVELVEVSGKFPTLEKEQLPTTPSVTPTPVIKRKTDEQKISEFLKKYGSKMQKYAPTYVKYAKKYGVDPKILVAISVTESSAGNNIVCGRYNAFSLMQWDKKTGARTCQNFESYDQAIHTMSATIGGRLYKRVGKTTIGKIGASYDPGNPKWVSDTKNYYNQIVAQ